MRILYFDLETKRSADEVGGWLNIMDMGMSIGILWDTQDEKFHIYSENQTSELFRHCKQADMVVGFNHVSFDYKVLAGCVAQSSDARERSYGELINLNNFDMLLELKKVLGHRLKLDSIASPTLKVGKSADGLQALEWYKTGELDKIIKYCKDDVSITRDVHRHALDHGHLLYDSRDGIRKVDLSWSLNKEKPQSQQMSLF